MFLYATNDYLKNATCGTCDAVADHLDSVAVRSGRCFKGDSSTWRSSASTTMERMFREMTALKADLNMWNAATLTTQRHMLANTRLSNDDLGAHEFLWSSDMQRRKSIFHTITAFNGDYMERVVAQRRPEHGASAMPGSWTLCFAWMDRSRATWARVKVDDKSPMFYLTNSIICNLNARKCRQRRWHIVGVIVVTGLRRACGLAYSIENLSTIKTFSLRNADGVSTKRWAYQLRLRGRTRSHVIHRAPRLLIKTDENLTNKADLNIGEKTHQNEVMMSLIVFESKSSDQMPTP